MHDRRGACRESKTIWVSFLFQQAENSYPACGADVNLAMGDGDGVEFVAGPELIAANSGLVGVVDLHESFGIVSVKNAGRAMLRRPKDGVLTSIRRDAGRSAGIREGV